MPSDLSTALTPPRTVFGVWYGEYEQRNLHCLFTTRELAEAYAKGGDVEEVEVWDRQPQSFRYYEKAAIVDHGPLRDVSGDPPRLEHFEMDESSQDPDSFRVTTDASTWFGKPHGFYVHVEGTDPTRVLAEFGRLVAESQAKLQADPSLSVSWEEVRAYQSQHPRAFHGREPRRTENRAMSEDTKVLDLLTDQACFAADLASLRHAGDVSAVSGPGGVPQTLTPAELTRVELRAGIRNLIANGLIEAKSLHEIHAILSRGVSVE